MKSIEIRINNRMSVVMVLTIELEGGRSKVFGDR